MMGQDDTTKYSPRIFVQGLNTEKRVVAGDEATDTDALDYRSLAGDQSGGVRLLAGDQQ